MPIVVELARLADDLAALRRELVGAPWTVMGSKGQDVANPLRLELHRTSSRYEGLARSLGVAGVEAGEAEKSWAGRRLARQRWG